MDDIHPLFRNDIPSKEELNSNDVYSALIEISIDDNQFICKKNQTNLNIKNEVDFKKILKNSKKINKKDNYNQKVKGKYQNHLNKIRITKFCIEENKKNQLKESYNINNDIKNFNKVEDRSDKKELAEMELCMSLWSNKSLFINE